MRTSMRNLKVKPVFSDKLYNSKYVDLLEKVTFSIVIFMHESSLILECTVDSRLGLG